MKTKRIVAALLAMVMLLTTAGCSTPKVAISVGDRDYSTGEYLAYLYDDAISIYYYYANYGDVSTMWEQTLPYENPYTEEANAKEDEDEDDEQEDNSVKLKVPEYIVQETQDKIVYLAALEAVMEEYELTISEDDMKEAQEIADGYTDAETLSLGFSKDNYLKMVVATQFMESSLFMDLYGKDGKMPTKDEDIRKYFDDNYLAYEIIQLTTEDKDGNDISDEVRSKLEGFYDVYEETGDFDKAIKAYNDSVSSSDDEEEENTAVEEDKAEDTEKGGLQADGTIKNVTSNNSDNVQTLDAANASDENLVKMIRSIKEGEVKILSYDQNGTSPMLALVYRIDPDGKGREDYYATTQEQIIKSLRTEDFQKLIWAKMDEQAGSVKINKRAIKMCDPKAFFAGE